MSVCGCVYAEVYSSIILNVSYLDRNVYKTSLKKLNVHKKIKKNKNKRFKIDVLDKR